MVTERTAAWALTATTADLLWSFHNTQWQMYTHRRQIATSGLDPEEIDVYARTIQADVDSLRAIVAELRRRGHNVAWEE